ncbi:uracil-DNA glycosylase family 4 [Sphingomonas sp. BE138]|uniref:uracil-DNA glycosylase n=1 Tax=Sphingomonas sp. BE138 TaxID=2817845 RepID=UPI00285FCD84|nr:uracil-DNA glycosylase [Sphingomonas sp. BE138]MDR6787473.1 uracil-DNA glycosylase family 4 [Sphingomonas sp. BE138]
MNFAPSSLPATEPPLDCPRCPRLVALRHEMRAQHPEWWNAPVPAFGDPQAWLAIVGLAPGMKGANRTGRAFIGDGAGALLYGTLARFGLAHGTFTGSREDDITLDGAIILNAVKCLPPGNAPTPEEVRTCRPFLDGQAEALPAARVFIALGQVAHQSVVKVLGGKLPKARFAHGAVHRMPDGRVLIDSYHCSRYNQNTGRLTPEMFEPVFASALELRP